MPMDRLFSGLTNKPDIVLFITDEQRAPPPYQTPEVTEYRKQFFKAETHLKENGLSFVNHYIASSACVPARASLLTGQYPSLHGLNQTNGGAKEANDPDMTWLSSEDISTLGHRAQALGYDTTWIGKFHLVEKDILKEDGSLLHPKPFGKPAVSEDVAYYQERNLLQEFGFNKWVGPEPHGAHPANTGYNRDPDSTNQFIAHMDELDRQSSNRKPQLIVVSYVNPHDEVLFPLLTAATGIPFYEPQVPLVPMPPTFRKDLSQTPRIQREYHALYQQMFTPDVLNGVLRIPTWFKPIMTLFTFLPVLQLAMQYQTQGKVSSREVVSLGI
ncbi:MAG: sulfatase-like hydrolase/transferase, partial [Legionellales bacterium]